MNNLDQELNNLLLCLKKFKKSFGQLKLIYHQNQQNLKSLTRSVAIDQNELKLRLNQIKSTTQKLTKSFSKLP